MKMASRRRRMGRGRPVIVPRGGQGIGGRDQGARGRADGPVWRRRRDGFLVLWNPTVRQGRGWPRTSPGPGMV